MSNISIIPDDVTPGDLHQFIIGAITPRPIALVSTINQSGTLNLAPYSFFNAFSSNPPFLVFSSNLKEGDIKEKDSLLNLRETKDCVVNIVNYKIHRQMSLCSMAFPYNVSEFEKSGLTPLQSDIVKSFRVTESPVQIECTVSNILALGSQAGAANLIICKIEKMHLQKEILTKDLRRIDPAKLDVVGRLGRSNYVRVNGSNIFELYQSTSPICIGYDALPKSIKHSEVLTGNEIAELAALPQLPNETEVFEYLMKHPHSNFTINSSHFLAKSHLNNGEKKEALLAALIPEFKNKNLK